MFFENLLFCGLLTTLSGCNNDNVVVDKHDGEQFDISLNQDKTNRNSKKVIIRMSC